MEKEKQPVLKRLRVTRTLVYEGDSSWIDLMLSKNFISTGKPFVCPGGRIEQTDLKIEEVKEEEKDGRERNDDLSDNS